MAGQPPERTPADLRTDIQEADLTDGLVLQEAERQGVTASQLTRAALAQAVGTKSSADRGAAVGDGGRERDAGIDSHPQSMV